MDFNINDKVRVQLTPHGRAVHAASHADLCKRVPALSAWGYRPPTEDADGWSEWQLWSLMATFGAHTSASYPLCFETAIQIVLPPATLMPVSPTPTLEMSAVRAMCR